MALKSPVRVGIVGLGRAGWDIHVKGIQNRIQGGKNDFKVTAVADPLAERREEAERTLGCKSFPELKDMLKAGLTDLIVVASRSADHAAHSAAALKAGNHVLCEKPMATTLAEADSMIRAAKKAKRKLFIHQNYRFFDEFKHLREVIDSGQLGEVFEIRAHWVNYGRRNDWQTLKKNGGGVLNNTGPHPMDYVLQFLDSPCVDVWSSLRHIKDAGDCEDHVKILLRGKNGRVVDLEISTACALPSVKWTILGSSGALQSDGKTSKIRYYDAGKVPALKAVDGFAPERRYGVVGGEDALPWVDEEIPSTPITKGGDFYDNMSEVLLKGAEMVVKAEQAREIIRVIGLAKKGTKFASK